MIMMMMVKLHVSWSFQAMQRRGFACLVLSQLDRAGLIPLHYQVLLWNRQVPDNSTMRQISQTSSTLRIDKLLALLEYNYLHPRQENSKGPTCRQQSVQTQKWACEGAMCLRCKIANQSQRSNKGQAIRHPSSQSSLMQCRTRLKRTMKTSNAKKQASHLQNRFIWHCRPARPLHSLKMLLLALVCWNEHGMCLNSVMRSNCSNHKNNSCINAFAS